MRARHRSIVLFSSATLVGVVPAIVSMGGCSHVQRTFDREPIASVRARGNEAFARRDYPAALRAYEDIAARHPESAHARYDIGRTLLEQGDPIGASEEFMVAHTRQPWVPEYTDGLAEALFQADRKDALFEMLRRESAQSEVAADHLRLGRYAARDGAMEEAMEALTLASRYSSKRDATARVELAKLHRELGDREGEVRELQHALFIQPGQAEAYARLRELGEVPGPSFAIEPGGRDLPGQ